MDKFTFVILHYETLEDTIDCVNSILENITYRNYMIVIVDNYSKNNSGSILVERYKENEKIHVILNLENLGFAKGNNIGYLYAKSQLKSDYIACINNDTIIEDREFIDKIIYKYLKDSFHVLGPDIISIIDKKHQNPHRFNCFSKKSLIINVLFKYRILLLLNYLKCDLLLKNILTPIRDNIKKNPSHLREISNVVLHGSCLVFSPLYVEEFNGLYDKTFMYMEEEILLYIAQKLKLKIIYYPDVYIFHKEESTTKSLYKKADEKRRFFYKNMINSAKVYLGVIKEFG